VDNCTVRHSNGDAYRHRELHADGVEYADGVEHADCRANAHAAAHAAGR
jgi:hypothetical protein